MDWSPIPPVRVTINGVLVAGLLRATIVSTNSFAADTFTLTFALGHHPLTNVAYWSELTAAVVHVSAGESYSQGDTLLMTGVGDSIHIDPIRSTATIEGRDYSARLIDSCSQQDFANQTASSIVQTLAEQHGLEASIHRTTNEVGRYYGDGYTKASFGQFSRFRSDWDIVAHLARECGFDAYVSGSTLYFQPPATSARMTPLSIHEVASLHVDRLIAFRDVQTRIQSWSSQDMTSYASQPNTNNGGFLFEGANLSSQQVDSYAERYLAELTRLRTVLSIEMPWNLALVPRSRLLLTGTLSGLDAPYTIDMTEWLYCTATGCRQQLRAVLI